MQNFIIRLFLPVCIILAFPSASFLQGTDNLYSELEEEPEKQYLSNFLSFDFDWNIPIGIQRDYLKKHTTGFAVRYFKQLRPDKPVFGGVSLYYGRYDQSTVKYYDFYLYSETSNCAVFSLQADLRYFPGIGFWIFEPFFNTSIGLSNSWIQTISSNLDVDESNTFKVDENSWTPVYLVELGTLIRIREDLDYIFGHLTFGYLGGNNNYYYIKKEDFDPESRPVNHFDKKSVPIQSLKMNIGLIAYF